MWAIFKVFIEFVTILPLFFMFGFFGREARGILAPRPGIEPTLAALEGEVLATGPPGKCLGLIFKKHLLIQQKNKILHSGYSAECQ